MFDKMRAAFRKQGFIFTSWGLARPVTALGTIETATRHALFRGQDWDLGTMGSPTSRTTRSSPTRIGIACFLASVI